MNKFDEVVSLIKEGYSHKEISRMTWIPKTTISRIRNKAGLRVDEKDMKSKSKAVSINEINQKLFGKLADYNLQPPCELDFYPSLARTPLQPYNLIYKNGEVDVDTQEDISQLERVLDRLQKKGYSIGAINYQGREAYVSRAMEPYFGNEDNVLVIGDIHEPVSIDWYLEFCREQQEKFDCGTIVFIWDIVDMNSFSYHEHQPEELNPAGEMALAKQKLADWYATFPKAKVCMWNHDCLGYRKAKTAWLLREFIKSPHDMFGAPAVYEFEEEFIIDDVIYTHGNAGNAWKKAPLETMSIVSWHNHTLSGVQRFRNRVKQIFGCQVGTGIDYSRANFDYARISPKQPILSCAVVLNNWTLPIVLPFDA